MCLMCLIASNTLQPHVALVINKIPPNRRHFLLFAVGTVFLTEHAEKTGIWQNLLGTPRFFDRVQAQRLINKYRTI